MQTHGQPDPAAVRRFYNPDWLDDDSLVAGFVARRDLFEFLRQDLGRVPRRGSVQHVLLVGPRGSGKTTLLKRLAVAIRREPDLSGHLIPLSFPEELYQLKNLADFWWVACEALSDELDRMGRRAEADRLDEAIDRAKVRGTLGDPYDAGGLRLLLGTCEVLGKRPVLLVDNLDMVMQRIDTKGRKRKDPLSPAYWALREALSTADAPVVIGGSVRVSEPFVGYDKAFYDFFATKRLGKLSLAEVKDVLKRLAELHGTADWEKRMRARRGRIQALYEMTGGNPRALGLIFDLLRQGPDSRAIDDFERLLDLTTPYYKARIEDLSEQAQVIMLALAQLRRRVTAAEIARQAGLETRTVSAQLDLLVDEGVVEKSPGKKTRYIIVEQLFRIWLQMRSSRRLRQRVMYLTEFLEAFYDREEVDALLRASGGRLGRSHTNAFRDYALAEWQGDTAIGRALRARAAEGLLDGPDGPPPAYAPGDFPSDHEALARCRRSLHGRDRQLDGLDRNQLLGSVSLSVQERCDAVDRLCDAKTVAAERERLRPLLAEERDRLGKDGLSDAQVELFYDLRAGGLLGLPDLTVDEVEAAAKTCSPHDCGELRRLAWALLGAERIRVRSPDEARRWLAFGRTQVPDAGSADWASVGRALRHGGFYQAAMEAVDEACRLGDCVPAWYERGVLLAHHLGRFEEAEAAFRKAIDLDPTNARSWTSLAIKLAEHPKHFEEAEAAFRKAIDLDPTQAWARLFFAKLLADHLGRLEEAEVELRKSIDLDPTNAWPWFLLGRLLADRLGRPEEAEAAFRKAIDLKPTGTWAWYFLGKLLTVPLARLDEAESAFRRAIELDPTYAAGWGMLGIVLIYRPGCLGEAKMMYQRAMAIDPGNASFREAWQGLWYRALIAPVAEAVAAEDWEIVREHVEHWIADRENGPGLWVSDALIEDVFGESVRLDRGETLLRLLREAGLDRVALPLVLALEAALAGGIDSLVDVEPEARAAAEILYARLVRPRGQDQGDG